VPPAPPTPPAPHEQGLQSQRRPRRTGLWLALATLITVGYISTGGVAGIKAYRELTREPTPAELKRAGQVEIGTRWRNWPAGRIFPERLPYTPEQGGRPEQATRIGIGTGTKCNEAVDAQIDGVLRRYGCVAVIRATYLDAPQGIVVTLGVVAFRDPAGATRAVRELPSGDKPEPGLRALGFPGTVTARFNDAARQASVFKPGGPYIVMATAGQADGRPAKAIRKQNENLFDLAPEMAERIATTLARPARPDCTKPETWSC
jgi:hypothetical protein